MYRSFTTTPITLLFFLLVLFWRVDLSAQTADYASFPQMDVDYTHLELQLNVSEDLLVEGNAFYSLETRRGGLDSLVLDAARIEVQQLEWNEDERDFRMEGDKLIVFLPEGVSGNEEATLRIRYRASPEFGIHRDTSGTIWSSLLPGAVRHWLPVFDHPRNTLTSDIRLVYPSGKQAVLNGRLSESAVESVDYQSLRFTSESPLPVTTLSFAIGRFEQLQTTVGRHLIQLHSLEGLLTEDQKAELLDVAYNSFRSAENHTGQGFPWRTLHIVVLEDDRWETKNYGAGVVYVYQNRSELSYQLRRGVASLWFGVQLREEQWSDAAAIRLLQSWLYRDLSLREREDSFEQNLELEVPGTAGVTDTSGVYAVFSPSMEEQWNKYFMSDQATNLRDVISRSAPLIMAQKTGVITWYDFANYLYDHTGQPFFTAPRPQISEQEEEEPYHYTATFDLDESEGTLRIEFNAENRPSEELISVSVFEVTREDTRSRELAFTGSSDEIVMNVNPAIENMKLQVTDNVPVILDIEKPFMFWVYQLRSDEDPESRKEAAVKLRRFDENPDLQLALLDFLANENNEEVIAETIRTLSAIVKGASGTDQLFLQRYRADLAPVVQEAIIESLADYEGNEQVIGQLQQVLAGNENEKVKEQAARSLAAVTASQRFRNLVETLSDRENVKSVVPLLLELLAEKGEAEAAVSMANSYLESGESYEFRSGMLDLLLEYDRSQSNWEDRLPGLLSDRDPRIRYRAADGLRLLTTDIQNKLIEDRIYEEYDERVRRKLVLP